MMRFKNLSWSGATLFVGIAVVALMSGVACNTASGRKSEADLSALPREAREGVDRAAQVYSQPLRDAKWTKIVKPEAADHPVYQLRGTNGRGHTIEMEITSAGRVIEVEEHGIPLAEVPTGVVDAVKKRLPNVDPTHVEAIYQMGSQTPVAYGFEGKDAEGREIEVYISADGKAFLN